MLSLQNTNVIELEFESVPEKVLVILFEYLFPGAFDHGEETDDDTSTLSDFSSSLEDYWCVLTLSRHQTTLILDP